MESTKVGRVDYRYRNNYHIFTKICMCVPMDHARNRF